MTIKRIKSGGIFEEKVGYCRAVVAGGFVHVAGTTAQGADIPEGAVEQCKSALATIEAALTEAMESNRPAVVDVRTMGDIVPDRIHLAKLK